jgi:hypothetical protein
MIHLRIIGFLWLISGLLPALKHPMNVWSLATHPEYQIGLGPLGIGFWVTQLFVELSFLLIMLIGLGLICLRRRAVVAGGILGVISLLVCVVYPDPRDEARATAVCGDLVWCCTFNLHNFQHLEVQTSSPTGLTLSHFHEIKPKNSPDTVARRFRARAHRRRAIPQ